MRTRAGCFFCGLNNQSYSKKTTYESPVITSQNSSLQTKKLKKRLRKLKNEKVLCVATTQMTYSKSWMFDGSELCHLNESELCGVVDCFVTKNVPRNDVSSHCAEPFVYAQDKLRDKGTCARKITDAPAHPKAHLC